MLFYNIFYYFQLFPRHILLFLRDFLKNLLMWISIYKYDLNYYKIFFEISDDVRRDS